MSRVFFWPTAAGSLAAIALFGAAAAAESLGDTPKAIPRFSAWADARHGWAAHHPNQGQARLYATNDGGRTWRLVFTGGNYIFFYLRTSTNTGLVETGNWGGATLWTRDGGRRWYFTHLFPGTDYRTQERSLVQAGHGSLLFWHQGGDTLYRIQGWPPGGDVPCTPDAIFPQPGAGLVCAVPPDEAGMGSVVAARLDRGAFGAMSSFARGVVALVEKRDGRNAVSSASHLAVYRVAEESFSLTPFPDPPLLEAGERIRYFRLTTAWPRLYVTAPVQKGPNVRSGRALWRSEDAGRTWTVGVIRAQPKRAPIIRGRPRPGSRTWIPGGFVEASKVGRRGALLLRQLGRTRVVLLAGAGRCTALEPTADWPHLFVEGRRSGTGVALWSSEDGGISWTRLGKC